MSGVKRLCETVSWAHYARGETAVCIHSIGYFLQPSCAFLHLEVESILDLISHKDLPQPLIYGQVKINEGELVEI